MELKKVLFKSLLAILTTFATTSALAETEFDLNPADPGVYSGHGYIYIKGFAEDKKAFVLSVLDFMKLNNYSFLTSPRGAQIVSYSELIRRITTINYTYVNPAYIAYTNGMMDINLYVQSTWNSKVQMATTFSHEADHMRYGSHSCGTGADVDINGPYGVQVLYGAKIYHNSALPAYERSLLYSNTASRVYNRLCGNADSIRIGESAIYSNIFPVAPPPPPPSPSTCTAKMRLLGICPDQL